MIFTQSLQKIDESKPQEAIKKMVNHIKYIQEQLEFTLTNLDSENINEIEVDKIVTNDGTSNTNLGSYIKISGANGESFTVGKNTSGQFEFEINGKNGTQTIYLNSSGQLVITELAKLTIDGGEW